MMVMEQGLAIPNYQYFDRQFPSPLFGLAICHPHQAAL